MIFLRNKLYSKHLRNFEVPDPYTRIISLYFLFFCEIGDFTEGINSS